MEEEKKLSKKAKRQQNADLVTMREKVQRK